KLYLTPARHDLGGDSECPRELLRGSDSPLSRLPVDEKNSGKAENQVTMFLHCHVGPWQSVRLAYDTVDPAGRAGSTIGARAILQALPPAAAPLATYGRTIFFGSTTRSKSASVTKPSFSAAAFRVRSLSMA